MHKLLQMIVCGVQRAGTTSLFSHLASHPQLSPPRRKELHFFDNETIDWSDPDYGIIDKYFPEEDGDRMRFEVTPIYSFWFRSLERIRVYNPAARLIFMFRDPYERAVSHWVKEYSRGTEYLSFSAAIRNEQKRLAVVPPLARERRIFSYLERGLYAKQARRALELFPREQLLFLRSGDLRDNRKATLGRIADFLDIAPFPDIGPIRAHHRSHYSARPKLTPADGEYVSEYLRDDLIEFASLTGLDIGDWPTSRHLRYAEKISALAAKGDLRHPRRASDAPPNRTNLVAQDSVEDQKATDNNGFSPPARDRLMGVVKANFHRRKNRLRNACRQVSLRKYLFSLARRPGIPSTRR